MVDTRKYNAKRNDYTKMKYANISFALDREKDAHIINWLKAQPNRTDYIRKLVAADMNDWERSHPDAVVEDGQIISTVKKNSDKISENFSEKVKKQHK